MRHCRNLVLIFLAGMAVSCGMRRVPSTIVDVIVYNKKGISQLSVGMPKFEVFSLMGRWPQQEIEGIPLANPYRSETIQSGVRTLDVAYYYTDIFHFDGQVSDDELTPLVFENDKLLGWGDEFLATVEPKQEPFSLR